MSTIAALIAVIAAMAAPNAQSPQVRDLAELLAALKEPKLTERTKHGFARQVFSGVVEIREVQEVPKTPSEDRPFDTLPTDEPAMRIMVEVGIANPHWYVLAFQTTDVGRASKLRAGDKVRVSGRLVRIVRHRHGYDTTTDDEWFIFDQVVIADK
jgi:hypothetical protein